MFLYTLFLYTILFLSFDILWILFIQIIVSFMRINIWLQIGIDAIGILILIPILMHNISPFIENKILKGRKFL